MFKELQILKLYDIYKLSVSTYMHRILMGDAPKMVTHEVEKNQNQHTYTTRQDLTYIKTPQYTLEMARKAFTYKGPCIWNDLPMAVRDCQSHQSFKRRLRCEIINSY